MSTDQEQLDNEFLVFREKEKRNTDLDAQLDDALSGHENLCEDQTRACGDCRRLKQALTKLMADRERDARIDELRRCCDECGYWHDKHKEGSIAQTFFERQAELERKKEQHNAN